MSDVPTLFDWVGPWCLAGSFSVLLLSNVYKPSHLRRVWWKWFSGGFLLVGFAIIELSAFKSHQAHVRSPNSDRTERQKSRFLT